MSFRGNGRGEKGLLLLITKYSSMPEARAVLGVGQGHPCRSLSLFAICF
jgi:hypothetical protein